MEDPKKEKQSQELKEELTDDELKGQTSRELTYDELKGLSGGHGFVEPRNFSAYADETPLSRQQ